jgi:hypothetical protein
MFREYAVEGKDRLLPPGRQNTLAVVFSSSLRFMRAAKRRTKNEVKNQ